MLNKLITAFLDEPFMLMGFFGALIIIVWLLHALYFYLKYQKNMEKELMGDEYYSGGFLYDGMRVMMYGHYILFPARAKKVGVHDFFSTLSPKLKRHLLFHWFGLIIGGICFFVPAFIYR
ncbi:hypothetical protein [Kangiella spongicola]|uniref:Uncharacterized protein n=1 Tax=Kangiella spongicola TaxID=796379 RepID=A0A318DAF5_9GAMM|nr:hypothetical protein [Kangiella spongicola]PXF64224.1 hypothetical protein DL796_03560 [Kangiella spongicola]